jgi:ClpP class serine protease
LAQGRVWTGVAAKQNGLVDRIGGLHEAIQLARELAKIGLKDEVEVVEYGPRGLFRLPMMAPSLQAPWAGIASMATFGILDALASRELLDADAETSATMPVDYDLTYLQQLIQNNGRALCMLPPDFLSHESGR